MSNFWTRTITGLSMVFILLTALFFSGWIFAGIFLVIVILGLWEFYGLITSETCQPQKYYGIAAGTILYIVSTLVYLSLYGLTDKKWIIFIPFLLPVPLFFLTFIVEIYRKKSNPLINIATTTLGFLYIALPLSFLNAFSGQDVVRFHGLPVILVGYFSLTWIFDTSAYLYGKQFGEHKFFERISPKKTWEGTIAGVVITYLAASGFLFLVKEIPAIDWLILATLVLVFGTFGDLVESLIKRNLNIKDSGKILPGHGGLLDRFDTILLSAPFVFLYFFLRNTC